MIGTIDYYIHIDLKIHSLFLNDQYCFSISIVILFDSKYISIFIFYSFDRLHGYKSIFMLNWEENENHDSIQSASFLDVFRSNHRLFKNHSSLIVQTTKQI